MSTINVKVVPVEIQSHPNADRLEVAQIGGPGGFACVVGLGQFKTGDLAIYIPPDSVVPKPIQTHLEKNKITIKGGRIRPTKIRGILSEGLCLSPSQWLEDKDIVEDNDVTSLLGVTKYEPPPPRGGGIFRSGKGINIHYENPDFPKYTSIENIKKHPRILEPGEEVVATIKMHGTNFRCGWAAKPNYKKGLWCKIKDLFNSGPPPIIDNDRQEFLVGSHNKIRFAKEKADRDTDLYWRAALKYNLQDAAIKMAKMVSMVERKDQLAPHDIVIYAEIIGPGIQKGYDYGIPQGDIEIRVFDISFRGQFLPWNDVKFLCMDNNLPYAEEVYTGPWKLDVVDLAQDVDEYDGKKYTREGLVIKPLKERWNAKCGRVIFKAINPDYLLDKTNSEYH